MVRTRPKPVLWLYYQYGGTLPATYREWVLHDSTCRTWQLRLVVRALVSLGPVLAVLVIILHGVVGGLWALVFGFVLFGVLVYLRFAVAIAADSVTSRLTRYGYLPEHAASVRQQTAKSRGNRR